MKKIYEVNGLPFFDSAWIRDRNYISTVLTDSMTDLLCGVNKSWQFHQIEAPCLIPRELVSTEYTDDDIHITQDLYLKPETTSSSYQYLSHLIEHQQTQPPVCIWQASKSFRRENDQVSTNVRLKEFYQQEFQCIVTDGTLFDYHELAGPLAKVVRALTGLEARVVDSDRLPTYSQKTVDIEVKTPHKWLEVCSISKRNDVPADWKGKQLYNFEFAFGLDRLAYAKRLGDG